MIKTAATLLWLVMCGVALAQTPFTTFSYPTAQGGVSGTVTGVSAPSVSGTGYANGTYQGVPATGGAGSYLSFNVTISGNAVSGTPTIFNPGINYHNADSISISRTFGVGSSGAPGGTVSTFTITNAGTGGTPGTYTAVALQSTNTKASGITATIIVNGDGTVHAGGVTIVAAGVGSQVNDFLTCNTAGVSGGFLLKVNTIGGTDVAMTVTSVSSTTAASRTDPTRWTDTHNVLDYGADPTGVSDSTKAIQTAVNYNASISGPQNAGTIYFPCGTYLITAPIVFDGIGSIIFRGEGACSFLTGTFVGYVLDRPGYISSTPGPRIIEKLNCKNTSTAAGSGCFRLLGNDVGDIRDCIVQAHVGIAIGGVQPSDTSFDTSVRNCQILGLGTEEAGSIGVMAGPESSIYDSAIVNFEHGIRAYGAGVKIIGNRIEVNKTGIFLGQDIAGNSFAVTGGLISPISLEANTVGVDAFVCNACWIGGFSIQGSTNAPGGASTYGIKFENGTGNTFENINISADASSYTTNGFNINPGSTFNTAFIGVIVGSNVGAAWSFTPSPTYFFMQSNNPTNAFPFASLPAPVEGLEYDITDGTNGLTWGQVATNTGTHTTHYHVRYNGTNWTVMGQ